MNTKVVSKFLLHGDFIKAEPFGNGHINDIFLLTFNQAGLPVHYILRKINKYVFKNPEIVINNTLKAIEHISKKLLELNEKNISRKVVTMIKSINDDYYYKDENGDYWCVILFFENAYTVDCIKTPQQAYLSAKEFGRFQKYLFDEDIEKYQFSIPDFHNPFKRIETLKTVIKKDPVQRVFSAEKEIEQVLSNVSLTDKLNYLIDNHLLPLRITHNDTKINNVMFDKETCSGLCVIDLDTVMPGRVIFDFGDMVRSSSSTAAEDEKDIAKVKMQITLFEALVKGYLENLSAFLMNEELNNLAYGAELIIYEQAVRFLTDYLDGDQYYHTNYKEHNLIRTRNQLALLDSVKIQRKTMDEIIRNYSGGNYLN